MEVPSLSILVVDDEPSVRETLAEMLEVMGHRVLLAESGQNALQTLAGNDCDLVFTDLAMPEMDGWETTSRDSQALAGHERGAGHGLRNRHRAAGG